MPRVSVVIPLYRKEDTIGRCINSILNQTMKDFEVIVVFLSNNDSPSIGNEIMVDRHSDSRIRAIAQDGCGVSAARNQGVKEAKSDLIAFLDADDEWTPEHLEVLLRLRGEYPQAGAYGTACYITDGTELWQANYSPAIPTGLWEGVLDNYWKVADQRYFPPLSTSNLIIPKNVFWEIGGFNIGMTKGEDLDLWGRIALSYPIVFSWQGMGIYHIDGADRLTITDRRSREIPSGISVAAWMALDSGEVSPHLKQDLKERIDDIQIRLAWINLKAGRPDLARKNILENRTKVRWWLSYWTMFWTWVPVRVFTPIFITLSKLMREKNKSSR